MTGDECFAIFAKICATKGLRAKPLYYPPHELPAAAPIAPPSSTTMIAYAKVVDPNSTPSAVSSMTLPIGQPRHPCIILQCTLSTTRIVDATPTTAVPRMILFLLRVNYIAPSVRPLLTISLIMHPLLSSLPFLLTKPMEVYGQE